MTDDNAKAAIANTHMKVALDALDDIADYHQPASRPNRTTVCHECGNRWPCRTYNRTQSYPPQGVDG